MSMHGHSMLSPLTRIEPVQPALAPAFDGKSPYSFHGLYTFTVYVVCGFEAPFNARVLAQPLASSSHLGSGALRTWLTPRSPVVSPPDFGPPSSGIVTFAPSKRLLGITSQACSSGLCWPIPNCAYLHYSPRQTIAMRRRVCLGSLRRRACLVQAYLFPKRTYPRYSPRLPIRRFTLGSQSCQMSLFIIYIIRVMSSWQLGKGGLVWEGLPLMDILLRNSKVRRSNQISDMYHLDYFLYVTTFGHDKHGGKLEVPFAPVD